MKYLVFVIFVKLAWASTQPRLTVPTVLQEPFITKAKKGSTGGYDGYEGILIDMIKDIYGNEYDLTFEEVQEYGQKQANGSFSGLIGELANNTIPGFALATVTVNSERQDAVKFSLPYITTGLSAIGKGVNFPVAQDSLPNILKMAQDGKITVGIAKGGSDESFFKNTEITIYKKLYEQMIKKDSNIVKDYDSGFAKVKSSSSDKPYVFFGEKTVLDYYAGKAPCDLHVSSCDTLNTIHYAIVLKKDAYPDFIDNLNKKIADYLVSGKMHQSIQKWYKNECNKGNQTSF